jgi:hypothetical protein
MKFKKGLDYQVGYINQLVIPYMMVIAYSLDIEFDSFSSCPCAVRQDILMAKSFASLQNIVFDYFQTIDLARME